MADFPHVQSGRGTPRIRQYENYLKAVRKLKWTPKRQNELEKRVLEGDCCICCSCTPRAGRRI